MGPEVWLLLTLVMPPKVPDIYYREQMSITECWKEAQAWVEMDVSPEERDRGAVGHMAACGKFNSFQEKM